jgi:hypothetical protein
MSAEPPPDPRPSDLNAFLDAIAKALSLPPEEVAKAFEAGLAEIDLIEDADGRRAVGVRIGEHQGVVALGKAG